MFWCLPEHCAGFVCGHGVTHHVSSASDRRYLHRCQQDQIGAEQTEPSLHSVCFHWDSSHTFDLHVMRVQPVRRAGTLVRAPGVGPSVGAVSLQHLTTQTVCRYSSSNSTSPRGQLTPNARASDVARKVGCSAETQTQPPLPPAPEATPIKLNLWQR